MATNRIGSSEKSIPMTQSKQLEQLLDAPFIIRFVLGGRSLRISDILKLGQGSILELDISVDHPFQLWVNNCLIAHAETIVVNEKFGAKILHVGTTEERIKNLGSQT